MPKFKPCPFCGCDTASLIDEKNLTKRTLHGSFDMARVCVVECDMCGARSADQGCQSKNWMNYDKLPDMAIEKWNERT